MREREAGACSRKNDPHITVVLDREEFSYTLYHFPRPWSWDDAERLGRLAGRLCVRLFRRDARQDAWSAAPAEIAKRLYRGVKKGIALKLGEDTV